MNWVTPEVLRGDWISQPAWLSWLSWTKERTLRIPDPKAATSTRVGTEASPDPPWHTLQVVTQFTVFRMDGKALRKRHGAGGWLCVSVCGTEAA